MVGWQYDVHVCYIHIINVTNKSTVSMHNLIEIHTCLMRTFIGSRLNYNLRWNIYCFTSFIILMVGHVVFGYLPVLLKCAHCPMLSHCHSLACFMFVLPLVVAVSVALWLVPSDTCLCLCFQKFLPVLLLFFVEWCGPCCYKSRVGCCHGWQVLQT